MTDGDSGYEQDEQRHARPSSDTTNEQADACQVQDIGHCLRREVVLSYPIDEEKKPQAQPHQPLILRKPPQHKPKYNENHQVECKGRPGGDCEQVLTAGVGTHQGTSSEETGPVVINRPDVD